MSGLRHRIDGPEDGPALVLGPSLGTTTELWAPQRAALAGRRTIRYDLPGHAGSPSRAGITLDDLAADVLAILDERGIARAAYAGVSLGGGVGLALALRAPERLTSLVLCCTSASFGPPEGWRDRAALVRREGTGPVADAAAGRWFTPGYGGADPYVAMLRAADPAGYAACCEALAAFDVRDRLDEIRTPTLVIGATEDPATPMDHAEVLAAGIPGARLAVVQDASHLAVVERAGEVGELIAGHLRAGDPR